MWTASRDLTTSPQSPQQEPSRPLQTTVTPNPPNGLGTFIGKSLVIKGEVSGTEPVNLEGRIEGPVSLPHNHLNIGRDGMVMSNVDAGDVVVRGTLHGKLTASDRVEIHSGGSLMGDVVAGRITIEDGAYFQGSIDMRRPDPKAQLENSPLSAAKENGKPGKDALPAVGSPML